MKKSFTQIILLILVVAFSASCSWSKKDKDPKQKALTDYRESRERSALEIPPDLSSDASAESMSVPGYKQTASGTDSATDSDAVIVTPVGKSSSADKKSSAPDLFIERAGSQRWLVVNEPYATTWSDVRDYILSSGLALEREDRDAGILVTTWADNYATNILRGSQKIFSKYLGSVYTAGSRDKFRIRVEPGRLEGTSEVYLTHKGMIEKVVTDNNVDPVSTIWEATQPDPLIEAEMLSLLMIHMGASEETVKTSVAKTKKAADRASIDKSQKGQPVLTVNNSIETAWRRVGQTLDRVGFSVEDRNKSLWTYFVVYADPELHDKKPGFFSKMFKKNKTDKEKGIYQILLTPTGDKTMLAVLTKDGAAAPDKVVTQIMNLLFEQLK